ncbi:MAG TPA: aldo/keto reductase [Polyangiaceae bacterium]|nr:aldo/keto reductase [Polyangiaceae bacterium]
MANDVATTTVTLNTGAKIPQVGLGVWQAGAGEYTRRAVRAALEVGYRHVDTARIYGNEKDVGAAIRASGIPRADVFVTTKLWNEDQGYDSALRAFDASLERLDLEYVDLYLIHWPVARKRLDSWRALERLFQGGLARAIGVSNYLVPHLRELLDAATVVPAVNQIELTPFLQRSETRAFCKEHGIAVEAYSPLTRGQRLGDPTVGSIAREVGRTAAQVLLRWGIQKGAVVLPKSVTPARISENAGLFDFTLSDAQMARLDGLEENLVTGWDPATQR